MGHITQCPHCSTHFRVVADQLKLSQGWVRCGQCGQEFDAQAALVDLAALTATPQAAPAQPPSTTFPPPLPESDAPPVAVDILLDDDAPTLVAPPESPVSAAATDLYEMDLELPDVGDEHAAPPVEQADAPPPDEPPSHAESETALAGPLAEAPHDEPTAAVDADAQAVPDVSFVRQARRRAFWQRPVVRVGLTLAAVLLVLALTVQVLVQQRERLAAAHPEWQPWLTALCEPLGCQIGPWRAIESVVIDGSALVRLRDNAYRFEVSLRNTSDLALAVPALELSLTNHRDEVVLRRVILAEEWSAPITQLPAQATQMLTVQMALTAPEDLRMSGYRALVFYP